MTSAIPAPPPGFQIEDVPPPPAGFVIEQGPAGQAQPFDPTRPAPISPQDWYRQTYGRDPTPEDQPLQTRWREDPEGMQAWEASQRERFGLPEPPPLSQSPHTSTPFENALRTFGQGASLGLADDVLDWTGQPEAARNQRLGTEIYRETSPTAATMLELGGMVAPALLGGLAATLPRTVGGRVAAGAATGAIEGEIAGVGYSDPSLPWQQRLIDAIPMAATTAAIGGAIPVAPALARAGGQAARAVADPIARRFSRQAADPAARFRAPPTTPREEFAARAHASYQAADDLGVVVNRDSANRAAAAIRLRAETEGFDPILHPSADRLLTYIERRAGQQMTLTELERLRQAINAELRSATNLNDARMLGVLREEFDDFVNNLASADLTFPGGADPQQGVTMLREARANWATASKLGTLEEAELRAQLSRSAYDRALQTEMARIVRNPNLRRQFSTEEISLMKKVAMGDRTAWGRLVNALGWFAPRGWGAAIPVTAALATGNIAPLLAPTVGTVARGAAAGATQRGYDRLINAVAGEAAEVPLLGGELGFQTYNLLNAPSRLGPDLLPPLIPTR